VRVLGIDEAGRGCVIGPMVVGGVVVDERGWRALESLGVKDSKKLSPKRREELAPQIGEIASGYELRLVKPARIDEVSLNLLDIEEIVFLVRKFSPEKVFFDVPTHPGGVVGFVRMVREGIRKAPKEEGQALEAPGLSSRTPPELSPKSLALSSTPRSLRLEEGNSAPTLIGENHADERYPVVSAVSILAKVERDRIISELREEYGDFGSGYPSDPKTQRFLREWFEKYRDFPPIVRRKWSTVQGLLPGSGEDPLF